MQKNIKLLSSRNAVEAAIAECDQLGREHFLAKYGYRNSRTYALVYKGREYDSKAIAGVAYGKQFGSPMTPREHSGGINYCVPVLQGLGFTVRGTAQMETSGSVKAKSKKNPVWTRDELMLALHPYLQNRSSPPGKASPKVAELSELLGRMSTYSRTTETYRTASGVYMKLMNFRSIDPLYTVTGNSGARSQTKSTI